MKKPETKRKKLEVLRGQLEQERASFIPSWRDCNDYVLPRRARFFASDANKGDRRNQKIIDSTATLAARTLRAGMMSGVTSPARPWKRLTTPDPEMSEWGPVKEWLHVVDNRMTTMFLRSNLYNILPVVYGDLGVFGTSPMSIEENFDSVIHCSSFPIGSYMIAKDFYGRVNVFFREFRMTVRQLIERFGERDTKTGKPDWSKFSEHVKRAYEQGEHETWIDVCHVIKPNDEWAPEKLESKYKRFESCYYEKGSIGNGANYMSEVDDNRYLSEKGYDYFPILAPRWETTGEDVYGTSCPGIDAIGDIKALQLMQKRKSQAIEKMVNPPMTGPTSLRNQKATILPGDITYVDVREGQQGFRPSHEVSPRIQELLLDIQDHQTRVQRAFYEDLFLMLASSDRRQITAREIEERHEEKLLALGPVLEQLNQDLLDPLIDISFDMMMRQGMIPEPPDEIKGQDLKVEYISVMAQAQKLVSIGGLERFSGFVQNLAAVSPDSLLKVDMDQMIDEYGEAVGISPRIIRSDEKVEEIRAQQQQALAAQQKAEMMAQASQSAKNLSETNLEGDNALNRILQQAKAGQLVPGQ